MWTLFSNIIALIIGQFRIIWNGCAATNVLAIWMDYAFSPKRATMTAISGSSEALLLTWELGD
jgi:hypothetical protein